MHRTPEPTLCMACLRRSAGVGIFEKSRTSFAWTCDDPDCIAATKRMTTMPPARLDQYELHAIAEAGKAVAPDIIATCMGALWESGVRSLEDVTEAQMADALDRLHLSGALAGDIKAALATYGETIRKELTDGNAPF